MFTPIPSNVTTYYLDTCVWGALREANIPNSAFVRFLGAQKRIAALSAYAFFELSKAPNTFEDRDHLFSEAQDNIYMILYKFVP